MNKTLLFLIMLSFFTHFTLAQDAKPLSKSFYSVSYFGEKVFHSGLQLSLNRSLYLKKDTQNQRNRLDVGFSISSYIHPKNHFGLRLTPIFAFAHTNKNGLEYGLKADAGFMRRFYQGKVFEVDDNGNVKQKYLAGQNSFTYGLYILLAKNWYVSKSKNIRFFIELGGFQETNYNGGNLFHPSINIGISKYLKLKR